MGRTRYNIIEKTGIHFLTCTVINWLPVFSRVETKDIITASLQFLQDENRLILYAYVIMENHLHLVASSDDLPAEIQKFKSFTARQIIDFLEKENVSYFLRQFKVYKPRHKSSAYQLWQEGSQPKLIQGTEMMRQKIEYIHNNPVKRGYVDLPAHWRYSSARNYEGMEGIIDVCTSW